mgnify:CR=1 FL=1
MTEQEKRKGGGGKLTRSETVTVRLDPKLRYLAELAARKQRRTLSSFIEWAVEDSLHQVMLYQGTGYNNDESISFADEAGKLWDVDEAERFARLAITYPDLLTHQDQEIWKLLNDCYLLLPAKLRDRYTGQLSWDWPILEDQVFPTLRRYWPDLMMSYSEGTAACRQWVQRTQEQVVAGKVYPGFAVHAKQEPEFDDSDIPF